MPLPESPPLGRLPFEPPPEPPPELAPFWGLWREEKFWACHEALEDLWRHEPDPTRKRFLQGLIHGAVAVFQFRRGNMVGAARQMVRARARLPLPAFEDLDTERFLRGIEREIEPALELLGERERSSLQVLEARLGVMRKEPGRAPEE